MFLHKYLDINVNRTQLLHRRTDGQGDSYNPQPSPNNFVGGGGVNYVL